VCNIIFSSSLKATDFNIYRVIKASDIIRTKYNPDGLNLYQGNGRFGCSYGSFGLHNCPGYNEQQGVTEYIHIMHNVRATHSADFVLPMMKYSGKCSGKVEIYSQHQSFYDGTLNTEFEYTGNSVKTTTWFDQEIEILRE